VYGTAVVLATAFAAARRPPRQAVVVVPRSACRRSSSRAHRRGERRRGVLALVPALVLLGLRTSGARVTAGRLVLALTAGAAVVTGFALLDLARPAADRTHLGRFAEDVADGAAGELLVRRRARCSTCCSRTPVTAALPLAAAVAVGLLLRPPPALRRALDDEPGLRHGLPAVGALAAVGFAVNDSGAAVPALALLVAVPRRWPSWHVPVAGGAGSLDSRAAGRSEPAV
jgi:hypothetical protein